MTKELPSLKIGQLESQHPIVLGGMSVGLTLSDLAAAVANEGGYGTIGGMGLGISSEIKDQSDYLKANEINLRGEIHKALEMSNNGNIGVNLMVAGTDYENLIKTAVESGAKYIVSGAGIPRFLPKHVEKHRKSGQEAPSLIPIVSSVEVLDLILRGWKGVLPGAIVVETPNKAGGHLGVTKVEDIGKEEFSLETVVPKLVTYLKDRELEIPVIAAGGIWNRMDIENMLDIKAGGVQMSTRFITTKECAATDEFKIRHVLNNKPIEIIKSPVGMPGRAIKNDFIEKINSGEKIKLGTCVECLIGCEYHKKGMGYCIIRSLDNVRNGKVDEGVLFTGTNGDRLQEQGIVSVKQIFNELFRAGQTV